MSTLNNAEHYHVCTIAHVKMAEEEIAQINHVQMVFVNLL